MRKFYVFTVVLYVVEFVLNTNSLNLDGPFSCIKHVAFLGEQLNNLEEALR